MILLVRGATGAANEMKNHLLFFFF